MSGARRSEIPYPEDRPRSATRQWPLISHDKNYSSEHMPCGGASAQADLVSGVGRGYSYKTLYLPAAHKIAHPRIGTRAIARLFRPASDRQSTLRLPHQIVESWNSYELGLITLLAVYDLRAIRGVGCLNRRAAFGARPGPQARRIDIIFQAILMAAVKTVTRDRKSEPFQKRQFSRDNAKRPFAR